MNIYTIQIGCLFLCVAMMVPAEKKTPTNQVLISTFKIKSSTREFYTEWHYFSHGSEAPQRGVQLLFVSHDLFQSSCVTLLKFCPTRSSRSSSQELISCRGLRPAPDSHQVCAHQGKPKILPNSGTSLISIRWGLNKSTPGLFRPVPLMQNWSGPL